MKLFIFVLCLFISSPCLLSASNLENGTVKYMRTHPGSYIKIHDYSVYATWSSVAILHNVIIENSSDLTYENIKVRICYSSLSTPGNIISQEVVIIPVTVPPHSKNNYLSTGIPFGGGAQAMNAVDIVVLGAEVVD